MSFEQAQLEVCRKYGVTPVPAPAHLKVGIARNVREGLVPLNAIRHQPVGSTTGWYIWAGEEVSEDLDFFCPLHIEHLVTWCPSIIPFLQLPPGWGVVLAEGYEDVWYDEQLATG